MPDHALRRRAEGNCELLGEMAAKGHLGRDKGLEIVVLVARCAATPFGIDGGRRILGHARGRLGRLFGKDIVEPGIECLLNLGATAEIAVQPFLLAGLERFGDGTAALAMLARLVAIAIGTAGLGELGPFDGRFPSDLGFRTIACPIQQRVPLQLFLDKCRQVEIGQLQQLDRLHQLRRHHQRLRLPEL